MAKKLSLFWFPIVVAVSVLPVPPAQAQERRAGGSALATEPGSIYVEDLMSGRIHLSVVAESTIYYQVDMQRVLGAMAPNTKVQLLAMTDTGYKIRGRARHGDVSGWMRQEDLKSADPKLPEKLKALAERRRQVDALIANHQVALGMTVEEVIASMGKPTQKSSSVTADGREDTLVFIIYESVPQITTARDQFGRVFQTTIYVKMETGRLTVSFKDGVVTGVDESTGEPRRGGAVKIVPGPINL